MSGRSITAGTAAQVKQRVWDGESQASIARALYMSQATVSRICSGQLYSDIPWPDGNLGAISMDKKRERRVKAKTHKLKMRYYWTPEHEAALPPIGEEEKDEDEIGEDARLKARIKRILAGGDPDMNIDGAHEAVVRQEDWVEKIDEAYHRAEQAHQDEFLKTAMAPEFADQPPVSEEESEPDVVEYEAYTWEECSLMSAGRCKFINTLDDMIKDEAERELVRQAAAVVYKAIELTVDARGNISWNLPTVNRLIAETLEDMRSRTYKINTDRGANKIA